MPETVDDFVQRFGGPGTVDDTQASKYFDRFASTREEDRDFENHALYEGATQHLGRLDDNEFHQAATNAYEQAAPTARTGFIQSILGGIAGRGMNLGSLAQTLGLRSTNPDQMDANDYARLANYARKEHPDVMRQAVQEQPAILKAMGNPILMGALTMAAAHLVNKQRRNWQVRNAA